MTGDDGWVGRALVAVLAVFAIDIAILVTCERLSRRERRHREERMHERQTMMPIEKADTRQKHS